MSDAVWIALISAAPPTIVALATLWVALRTNTTAKTLGKKVEEQSKEIKNASTASNVAAEKLDLLATGAHWRGFEEGVAEERKRNTDFGKLQPEDWRG